MEEQFQCLERIIHHQPVPAGRRQAVRNQPDPGPRTTVPREMKRIRDSREYSG